MSILNEPLLYPNGYYQHYQGLGLTSQRRRDQMIARLVAQSHLRLESEVLRAMRHTPRHLFVDEALAQRVYEDCSLPIGYGQTLSHPRTVAVMTSWLNRDGFLKDQKILEIGTGSGYQTAILAWFSQHIYSLERIEPLQSLAKQRLLALGYEQIRFALADGELGWSLYSPYPAILCAASAPKIPTSLIEQLAPGGRLVLPVGVQEQRLIGIEKDLVGQSTETDLGVAQFVPLLSGLYE
ncbi:protein-L-isoaspartate(D-aspartate) O-methyltransferase [Thiomicrospira cyclica]|uniref:Protein-L-isoaspartate O-methyltransferase n=1 Tax=Thiomicrospira cyclica (strain DSM 14477 / JCM 11371 / ALM1) TaxID=717773 RepID=F6DCA1_THICA|nr:protein-L-isoaspartate(D-aspartate) O-methyltransferase [Thiomicrospira cyclica]AEG31487.1 Protein-L-isoaspartate O-methyltransferase [Thiomicrospira cyclica ALM1]